MDMEKVERYILECPFCHSETNEGLTLAEIAKNEWTECQICKEVFPLSDAIN